MQSGRQQAAYGQTGGKAFFWWAGTNKTKADVIRRAL
jgi:hypothetical protein